MTMMNIIDILESEMNVLESKVKSCEMTNDELTGFNNNLLKLEFKFVDYENYLLRELELINSCHDEMKKGLKSQNIKLSKILKAIPAQLLREAEEKARNLPLPPTTTPSAESQPPSDNFVSSNSSVGTKTSQKSSSKSRDAPASIAPSARAKQENNPPVFKKSIDLITVEEFAKIPSYQIGRNTIEKLNAQVQELNVFLKDKHQILGIPEHKLVKQVHRDLVYNFKSERTKDTKGLFFFTEKELREKQSWTSSKFTFSSQGRAILTILRVIGRLKEVRGGQVTRYCLI